MAADPTILTELCSICHANTPKYKCPRCFTRTCSLPCIQRHKTRASCTGIRDPAAFIKRSQLSHPATFDQDFNFLSGLERSFTRSAENLPASQHGHGDFRRKKANEHSARKAYELGIRVVKAPKGMKREMENQSRVGAKSKQIVWTVEWVLRDGRRCLTTVGGGQMIEVASRTARALLGLEAGESKKRKRRNGDVGGGGGGGEDVQENLEGNVAETTDPLDIETLEKDDQIIEESISLVGELVNAEPQQNPDQTKQSIALPPEEPHPDEHPTTQSIDLPPTTPPPDEHTVTEPTNTQNPPSAHEPEQTPTSTLSHDTHEQQQKSTLTYTYHLLKPHTSLPHKVLIPLSPTLSLNENLKGQTIIEFPTIYVLANDDDHASLLDGFISVDEYEREFVKQQEGLKEGVGRVEVMDEDKNGNPGDGKEGERMPNGSDILAILQRDIGIGS